MILHLDEDLALALSSDKVLIRLETLIRRVVREELVESPLFDQLLDVQQAAELLGITKSAVWKASEEGRLPTVRHGRRLRFRRRDLMAPTTRAGKQLAK